MAEDSGDKTEKPTPKKLQDARKKGDIAKSRDVSSTAGLLAALLLALVVLPLLGERISALVNAGFAVIHEPFSQALPRLAHQAWMTLLMAVGLVAVPLALLGVLVEFIQTGPVLTTEKFKPKGENLSPTKGFKRIFSMNNAVELLKSILKTVVVGCIAWLAFKSILPYLPLLPEGQANQVGDALWQASWTLLTWVVGAFVLIAAADMAWQRYSFTKKMRMSLRDIRKEAKEAEGDPHIRGQRKQLQQEWAQQGADHAASEAHVLVVNPSHVAIALHFEFPKNAEQLMAPTVAAKAVNDAALSMRHAAQKAGVPVLRNVELARQLLADVQVGEVVPNALYGIVASVIVWAQEVRYELNKVRNGEQSAEAAAQAPHRVPPPGEDLTRYDIGPYQTARATRRQWMRYVPRRWRKQPPSTTTGAS